MPAKSISQRRYLGMQLAKKERGESTDVDMSTDQLKDYASTKEKGLPYKKSKKKYKRSLGK